MCQCFADALTSGKEPAPDCRRKCVHHLGNLTDSITINKELHTSYAVELGGQFFNHSTDNRCLHFLFGSENQRRVVVKQRQELDAFLSAKLCEPQIIHDCLRPRTELSLGVEPRTAFKDSENGVGNKILGIIFVEAQSACFGLQPFIIRYDQVFYLHRRGFRDGKVSRKRCASFMAWAFIRRA